MTSVRPDNEIRKLQWEYAALIDDAYSENGLDHGEFTQEGVGKLAKAALIQIKLSKLTTGAVSSGHHDEAERLDKLVRRECRRLAINTDILPAAPQEKPAASPIKPTVSPVKPAASGNKPGLDNEETGEHFNLERYILQPGPDDLDSMKIRPDLIMDIKNNMNPEDPASLFPVATKEWSKKMLRNFLLYGPPGTGKSHLCRAICATMHKMYPNGDAVFYLVKGSEIVSRYRGTTENRLRVLFEDAKNHDFTIICIDEVEKLCPDRENTENKYSYTQSLLELMEGVEGRAKAMILASTNYPEMVDLAIRSRLGTPIFMDYPTAEEIANFFRRKKECLDALGYTDEEVGHRLGKLSAACAERKFSYRNLLMIAAHMRTGVTSKTLERYPEGSRELEHMIPLDEEEINEILMHEKSDHDPKRYQKYLEFDKVSK